MNKKRIAVLSKGMIPYAIIFAFSLIGTILVFWKGINYGDDLFYHLPNILDRYNSVINGNGYPLISAETANGFGYGAGLFYSPLSHFTVVVLGVVLRIFGISLLASYEITIVLMVFLSGVFMYNFAMKLTSNNKIASVIASAFLVLYPYRLFNIFCRAAFAEAFAFTFLPLFLCGVYEITHMNKSEIKTLPFAKLILGASFIFLSHNITAVFAFIVGFLFFLLYTKKLLKLFTSKKYIILCGISALLVIGISAIALFSQLELLAMDYYAVSNDVSMRTDVESVLSHIDRNWIYSGFLNIPFLSGRISFSNLYNGIVMFLIGCFVFVVADLMLSRVKRLKYFHQLIATCALFFIISLTNARRLELYLGAFVFVALYTLVSLNEAKETSKNAVYKRPVFWFSIGVVVLSFCAMSTDWVWEVVPGFIRTVQFPWRLWTFVQMFLSVLVALLVHHFAKRKNVVVIFTVFVGLLLVLNMPIIEKRTDSDARWFAAISESDIDRDDAIGHQKEYCPQIYIKNDYKPRENSLYYAVRNIIIYKDVYDAESLVPVILEGDGKISGSSITAPRAELELELDRESEIQLPLFYYPGYKVYAYDESGSMVKITPYDVDGLLSFKIGEGKYTVKTDFVGTPVQITGRIMTVVSVISVLVLIFYGLWTETSLGGSISKLIRKKARI